ncbi:MAG: AMP-binding protein, partial [Halobacteria archaeon]|nr:AMP-binding protein [Halobacteria archaeon]
MAERMTDKIPADEAGTLAGLFRERVGQTPDTVAYRQYDEASGQWNDSSWADMAAEVARWQSAFATEDLQPGDRVAILLRNCREWVIFDQAALGSGLVVVPLYTDDRAENSAYILNNAGVKLLLLQGAEHWERLLPVRDQLGTLSRILTLEPVTVPEGETRLRSVADWLPEKADALRNAAGTPDDLATIVYTSGTTGRPKGVMLTHHNMLSIAHSALTMIDVYQEDLFLSFLPLSHTLERTGGYYLPVMSGSGVAYARSIMQLADDLQHIRPTVMIAVPRIFERVFGRIQGQLEKQSRLKRALFNMTTDIGWHRFQRQQKRASWHPKLLLWPLLRRLVAGKVTEKLGGRLRLAVSGGAALSLPVAKTFIGLGVPILQGYGLTETSPVISVN